MTSLPSPRPSPLPTEDPSHYAVPGYRISVDPADLDFATVHGFLTRAYWSEGIARADVEEAHRHSLVVACLTAPDDGFLAPRQVGGARLVTDRVAFAYLADVFVLPDHRRRGLARWIVATALAHPDLGPRLRRYLLFTRDAQPLYRGFGFATPETVPSNLMIRPGPGYRPVAPAEAADAAAGATVTER